MNRNNQNQAYSHQIFLKVNIFLTNHPSSLTWHIFHGSSEANKAWSYYMRNLHRTASDWAPLHNENDNCHSTSYAGKQNNSNIKHYRPTWSRYNIFRFIGCKLRFRVNCRFTFFLAISQYIQNILIILSDSVNNSHNLSSSLHTHTWTEHISAIQ